jgi:hypothetical protein
MKQAMNDFRIWMARMGFRGKGEAGRRIGIMSDPTTSAIVNGKRELTPSERLAMSAVRAGLQPWTPDYDDELMSERRANRDSSAA